LNHQTLQILGENQVKAQPFQARLDVFGVSIVVIFIVSIYLSTALAIILSGVLGGIWLLTAQFKILPAVLVNSSVAKWALLSYLCFFMGLFYGDAPTEEAYSIIRKYRELLFIPLLSCFFVDERYRSWAWKAFVIASILTLIGSYLMDFGILDVLRHKTFTLKSRITHSIFIAFFMFYCAHKAFECKKINLWYPIALMFGTFNLFFVVEGRTGQLIFIFLAAMFAMQRFGKKGLLLALVGLILFVALYFNFSEKSARLHEGIANTIAYFNHVQEKGPTSMGLRYTFWENSVKLVTERPWLGHGTGSFGQEYERVAGESHTVKNPHNEFLLIAVQFGLMGIVTYAGFLFSQYRYSLRLPDEEKWLAQGLLLTLIITSLFNSPFLDHTEGHWFAVMIALCFAPNLPVSSLEKRSG
jgi:O-antigen ligase